MTMALCHFSEQPGIKVFEPRSPLAHPDVEPLVWAIDEWHAPMYYLPRDCPRACFWPSPVTTAADRERWFNGIDARMVIAIESRWLGPLRATTLYRYEMPAASFVLHDAQGGKDAATAPVLRSHYASRAPVTPSHVEPVGDLLDALAGAHIELRITPSLIELWRRVMRTTLAWSGMRLRHAQGYDPALFA
jgi:hypothetical protein